MANKCVWKKYRRLPVVVEATQYHGESDADFIPKGCYLDADGGGVFTEKGRLPVAKGDFVVRESSGRLQPCSPVVFQLTHKDFEPILKEPTEYGVVAEADNWQVGNRQPDVEDLLASGDKTWFLKYKGITLEELSGDDLITLFVSLGKLLFGDPPNIGPKADG